MARITKQINELMEEFADAEAQVEYSQRRMREAYKELKSLGMTDKQLQKNGIFEP